MTARIRPFVIVARTVIIAFVAVMAVSSIARAQTTALYLDSQPGDWVGRGTQTTKTTADATFAATRNGRNGVQVNVTRGTDFWMYLYFGATGDVTLVPGDYRSATRFWFTKFNGLEVSGNGAGCNTITGWFRVLEVEYDVSGNVTRFAADFEQHCDNATPALFGAIRYNSSIASLVPFGGNYPVYSVTVMPSDHGTVTGGGIDCNTGSSACAATFAEPSAMALTASPDAGYRLLSWSGDCQGGEVALLDVNGPRVCTPVFGPVAPVQPRSALVFDSIDTPYTYEGQREYIGQGEERRYSTSNAIFRVNEQPGGNYVAFWIETNEEGPWSLAFRAPNGGVLSPGEYDNATRASFSGLEAGLDFYGDSRGCNTITGRFIIYESTFADDGSLAAFAADFEQHCEGAPRPLYGAIRYHSTIPDVIPFGGDYSVYRLNVLPSQHGRITGGPLNCGTFEFALCTMGVSSPTTVSLTATPDDGYSATRWSDACTGTAATVSVTIDTRNVLCGVGFASFHLLSFSADRTAATPFNPITWTAVASPQTDVEYEFWRLDGGRWTLVQPYGPSATYSWTPSPTDAGTHAIQVWARGSGSTRQYDDWRSLTFLVQPEVAPVIQAFSADHGSPVSWDVGPITWTVAAAAGSSVPQYEFWRLDADGWHLVQPYGTSNTYTWAPTIADVGSHTIQVWVRNTGSPSNYETWQGTTFTVAGPPPVAIVSFRPSNTPAVGVTTTWTAQTSGGIVPLQYQFWRLDGDGWHMVQDYGPTATYSWTPGASDVGSHALQVWAKSATSLARYDAWSGVSFLVLVPPTPGVTVAALGPIPAAGQGSITWKATASGGIAPYQYRFWRLDADGWHIAQDYSATDTYTWSPGVSDSGTHAIQAWVRISGSSSNYDAWVSTGYFTVPIPPPVSVSFSAAPALPGTAGVTLTWTATTSTSSVEYEFWRYDDGVGWSIVQAYGPSATYSWTPDVSELGTHALQVWVRRVGSVAAYDGWIGTGYFMVGPP